MKGDEYKKEKKTGIGWGSPEGESCHAMQNMPIQNLQYIKIASSS